MPPRPRRIVALLAFAALLATARAADACSVPVFRYALERWPADPYQVVVFYRGKMSEKLLRHVRTLESGDLSRGSTANLQVRTVDLAGEVQPRDKQLWKQQKSATLPWMVVRYPAPIAPAWSGTCSSQNIQALVDSPARKEIAKRILAGQTAVWVLLESGKKADDDAAFKTLAARLLHEQKHLKLPPVDEKDIADGLASAADAKLKIKFSIVRISRSDAREKLFVEMLLGSEGSGRDSLRDPEYARQTMAFPIFGRGRVLYGLVGKGISKDTIHDACNGLVGPCTCQVKSQNPGMDLVMSVDWDRFVAPRIRNERPLPPLAGLGGFLPARKAGPVIAPRPASRSRVKGREQKKTQ